MSEDIDETKAIMDMVLLELKLETKSTSITVAACLTLICNLVKIVERLDKEVQELRDTLHE